MRGDAMRYEDKDKDMFLLWGFFYLSMDEEGFFSSSSLFFARFFV